MFLTTILPVKSRDSPFNSITANLTVTRNPKNCQTGKAWKSIVQAQFWGSKMFQVHFRGCISLSVQPPFEHLWKSLGRVSSHFYGWIYSLKKHMIKPGNGKPPTHEYHIFSHETLKQLNCQRSSHFLSCMLHLSTIKAWGVPWSTKLHLACHKLATVLDDKPPSRILPTIDTSLASPKRQLIESQFLLAILNDSELCQWSEQISGIPWPMILENRGIRYPMN